MWLYLSQWVYQEGIEYQSMIELRASRFGTQAAASLAIQGRHRRLAQHNQLFEQIEAEGD
jgi:hypothetical protein